MNADQIKGHNLEQRLAAFLADHGYAVSTNVHLRGRSGATHELDVVGDKSDGLTSFRLVVECKAWASAIDKDVVYKLAGVLADLGAAKGVIATLSGWTIQAAQVATQASIELWGPAELAVRLGSPVVEGLHVAHQQVAALGVAFSAPEEMAKRTLDRVARRRLGLGGNQMEWFGPTWLPAWSLQLGLTKLGGIFRNVPRLTHVWNSYEALSGRLLESRPDPPSLRTVDVSSEYLRHRLQASQVADTVTKAFKQWQASRNDTSHRMLAVPLLEVGLEPGFDHITVEATNLTYYPLWIAFLNNRDGERIVAADGVTGKHRRGLGQVLTVNAQLVRDSLNRVVASQDPSPFLPVGAAPPR